MSKGKGGQKINTGALTDQDRKYYRRNKKTAKTLSSSTKIKKKKKYIGEKLVKKIFGKLIEAKYSGTDNLNAKALLDALVDILQTSRC